MTTPHLIRAALAALGVCLAPLTLAQGQDQFSLETDDSVIIVGNSFAERMAMSGYLESLIHAAHPDDRITVRQVPWSADEAGFQPRELNVPHTDAYLAEHSADVIIACFGMSESFAGGEGLNEFESDLATLVDTWQSNSYNGASPPRVVLVSPIAHEDLGGVFPTGPEVTQHNIQLAQYTDVIRNVAEAKGARFIDLFAPASLLAQTHGALSTNGIHPSELGCWAFAGEIGRQLGWVSDSQAEPATVLVEALRWGAWDKHYHFRYLYRPTNTEYIWGRRAEPFGVVNFPFEQAQLRIMIDARQRALWEMPKPSPEQLFSVAPAGQPIWERVPDSSAFPEDKWELPEIVAEGTETSLGGAVILPPDQFLESFTLADGYVIECFASEQDFPELQNPLAMTFDEQHRLWVLCSPTYPHLLPGEQPHDRLLILTDTDGDGRADECQTFADEIGVVTAFAIDTDAVYLAQSPDLIKLVDTDGDGKADRREVVLSGFAMPDSHHQISAFEWSPDGGFVMHEGTFSRAGIETPFGTRRGRDAAIWHFEPRTQRLECVSHCGFPNPWGHAFDDFGASIMDSTSGGSHHAMSYISTAFDFPRKPGQPAAVLNRGRPTAGNEIVFSRHFPDAAQGSHLTTQSIGFHGLRWDSLAPGGSSWTPTPMAQDLVQSSDTNFRPVAVEIGPDGAAYILDWSNPIIGHMQYSVRDPRRDHDHGRVWRVRHAERALVTAPDIIGATVPELLDLLRIPERNTRQHARRRLQTGDPTAVLPALLSWMDSLDQADPVHDRLMLEALWIKHGLGVVDLELATNVVGLPTPEVRAGGVRVVRRWLHIGAVESVEAFPLLDQAVRDDDMRVRLEGVVASGFAEGLTAASIAQIAAESEMDDALRKVLDETLVHLSKYGEPDSSYARLAHLRGLAAEDFLESPWEIETAMVALERADVPREIHLRALETAGGSTPAGRVLAIVEALLHASETDAACERLCPLLIEEVQKADNTFVVDARLREHKKQSMRAVASAWAIAAGEPLVTELEWDSSAAVSGLSLRASTPLQTADAQSLTAAIEGGLVDPSESIAVLMVQSGDPSTIFEWLADRVDAVEDQGFEDWGQDHTIAMAALSGMHMLDREDWPTGYDRYAMDIDSAATQLGREVYYDVAMGCVRCHGQKGEGIPGFPPLAQSPWVLGDPERAAAIVVHGLLGEVTMPDGQAFLSAMAPLGMVLTDEEIANTLTFVRTSWGNFAPPVSPASVRIAREKHGAGGALLNTGTVLTRFPFKDDRLLSTTGVGLSGRAIAWAALIGALSLVLLIILGIKRKS